MKPVRLRFTGEHAETFSTANVGTVEPGAEFSVPEDMADRFLVRRDIEPVDGSPRSRKARNDAGGDQGGDQGAPAGADTNTGSGDAETGSSSPGPSGDGSGETDPNT